MLPMWCSKKQATMQELVRHVTSLPKLQTGSRSGEVRRNGDKQWNRHDTRRQQTAEVIIFHTDGTMSPPSKAHQIRGTPHRPRSWSRSVTRKAQLRLGVLHLRKYRVSGKLCWFLFLLAIKLLSRINLPVCNKVMCNLITNHSHMNWDTSRQDTNYACGTIARGAVVKPQLICSFVENEAHDAVVGPHTVQYTHGTVALGAVAKLHCGRERRLQ